MQEVTSMMELLLHKVIREKEEEIIHLKDMVARHKLGHDNDVRQLERLEMEILDRDECIYKLNKQCFNLQEELKKYNQIATDFAPYTIREIIDIQQKEIESLNSDLLETILVNKKLESILFIKESVCNKKIA